CDLPPHRLPLSELLHPRRDGHATPLEAHVPAITVLTTAATIDWLEAKRLLPGELLRLQVELRSEPVVGLRIERGPAAVGRWRRRRDAPAAPAALALRTRMRAEPELVEMLPQPQKVLTVQAGRGRLPGPLPEPLCSSDLSRLKVSLKPGEPLLAAGSHAQFFEHRHLDLLETTAPWSGGENGIDADMGRGAA